MEKPVLESSAIESPTVENEAISTVTKEQAEALQARFHKEIPATELLGISVMYWDGHTLQLQAPFEQNHNDKGTAFAGSLATAAIFSGWVAITLHTEASFGACQAAVYDAHLRYLKPVVGGLVTKCHLPDADRLASFDQTLVEKGRAKIEFSVEVATSRSPEAAVLLTAAYVVSLVK